MTMNVSASEAAGAMGSLLSHPDGMVRAYADAWALHTMQRPWSPSEFDMERSAEYAADYFMKLVERLAAIEKLQPGELVEKLSELDSGSVKLSDIENALAECRKAATESAESQAELDFGKLQQAIERAEGFSTITVSVAVNETRRVDESAAGWQSQGQVDYWCDRINSACDAVDNRAIAWQAAASEVSFVVDDAGCGRELGADPHAIVRNGSEHKYASVLVGWQCGFEPLYVAVHSYLDCELDDDECEEMAREYLNERGWLSGEVREADFVVRK